MAAKPPPAKIPSAADTWPGTSRLDEVPGGEDRPKDIWINNYTAVETAVMETPRGRWFLAEHARRNRLVEGERVLKAIAILARRFEQGAEPPDQAVAAAGLRQEIGALQDQIGRLRGAITADAPADPAPAAAPALADLGDIADRLHLAGFDRSICETFDQQLGVLSRIAADAVETHRRHAQLLSLVDIVERRLARLSGRAADTAAEEEPAPEAASPPAKPEIAAPPAIVPAIPAEAAVPDPRPIVVEQDAPAPAVPAPEAPREAAPVAIQAPPPAPEPKPPRTGSLAKTIAEIFAWHDSELTPPASKPAPAAAIAASDPPTMTQAPSLAPDREGEPALSGKAAAPTSLAVAVTAEPEPKAEPDILEAAPIAPAAEAQAPDTEAAQARDAIETAQAARANDDSSPAPPPDFAEPPLLGRPDPGPLGPVAAGDSAPEAAPKPALAAPPPRRAIPKMRYELAEIAAMAPRERLAFFS